MTVTLSPLATAVHVTPLRPLHDTRAFLVTDVGRPVGVAVLDEIRRGSACSARVSVWIHRGDRLVAGRWEDHVLFERAITSGG